MVSRFQRAALLLALATTSTTTAFTPSKSKPSVNLDSKTSKTTSKTTTSTTSSTSLAVGKVPGTTDIFHNYGEESRKYRRTVYTHEDWVKHRSPNRFGKNLRTSVQSGIFKNLSKEVIATSSIAAFLVAWNCAVGDYTDLMGVVHDGPLHDSTLPVLALPLSPFTLLSPSLGLLLVFRTKASYKRWDEARKNWGMNINHTRDLVRMGNAYYDREKTTPDRAQEDLDRLAIATWSFVRSMKRHLSPEWEDEEDFQKELYEKLPKEQAENIINAAHRPNRALQDLSTAIENLPMHFMRRNEVHAAATIFEDNLGSSERLLSSPIPVYYSRWTARFLSVWLLLLPLGLWGPLGDTWNHVGTIPATTVLSIFLFGIEELATQLEEPFTILPMQGFCDKIYNWITEIATFVPGDNGMPVYTYDNDDVDIDSLYVSTAVAAASVMPVAPTVKPATVANGAHTAPTVKSVAVEAPPAPTVEATPEVVEVVEDVPEVVEAVEDEPEIVEDVPEDVEAVEDVPEVVEVVEDVPEVVEAVEDAPEVVEVVEDAPEVVEVVEDAPEVVEAVEDAPEVVEVVEDVPEIVEVVEDVPEVVEAVEDAPKPVEAVEDAPETVEAALEAVEAALEVVASAAAVEKSVGSAPSMTIEIEEMLKESESEQAKETVAVEAALLAVEAARGAVAAAVNAEVSSIASKAEKVSTESISEPEESEPEKSEPEEKPSRLSRIKGFFGKKKQ